MTVERLFPNTDMVLQLTLTDRDDVPVTNAAVQVTALTKRDGSTPDGIVLPLDLAHTSGGVYEAPVSRALDVSLGDVLEALVISTSGGLQVESRQTIKVVKPDS